MAKKEISWILSAKDKISNVLKRTSGKLKAFAGGGIAVAKKFAAGFAVMGAAVIAVSSKMIQAYHKQAQAEAKLTAVLRATGYAAGFTASELKDQASALQKSTGIGDEMILSMQGVLASFRNISGEQFTDATKAILDMSTVLQKAGNDSSQIEQKAIQVGKALNDPIQGITMLTRVGVTFTQAQKDQIRVLQESGDMIGAQRIVLDELKKSFGGAAEGVDKNVFAYRNFQNSLGDTYEEIGKVITEGAELSGFFNKLADKLDDLASSGKITLWAEKLGDALKGVNKLFGPLIAGISWLYNKGKDGVQAVGAFAGNLMETGSFSSAFNAALDAPTDAKKSDAERLEQIKQEKAEQKQITAEKEKQEMIAAQIKSAQNDKEEAEAKALDSEKAKTKQVADALTNMEYQIKLQKLLNKGLSDEAELMKIQKNLGRDLTETEKESLLNKIRKLEALKKEEELTTGKQAVNIPDFQGDSVLAMGGMIGSQAQFSRSRDELLRKQFRVQQELYNRVNELNNKMPNRYENQGARF